MKKTLLLLSLGTLLFASCSEDSATEVTNNTQAALINPVDGNKVLLLKVDLLTNDFEGGKELSFDDASGFTIDVDYVSPGDFGSVALNYAELNQPLFAGTIHWMGLGQITYPEALDAPETFEQNEEAAAMPAIEDFTQVEAAENFGEFYQPDHQAIWNAIDNLEAVKAYRQNNPDAEVQLFLYTPSVGDGNPADWDWIVMLKN